MLIQGRVTVNDANPSGVANVKIYRGFANYPGVVVATTDQNGYYATDFQPIPGDEQVTVWAEREGYVFEPVQYSWRHYFGYKVYRLDFSVKSVAVTATPTPTPTPTSTLLPVTEIPPTATSTATSLPPTDVPPTPTSTATAEPAPDRVVLNEILPAPQHVDWNGDGSSDMRDEWIEVVNLDEGAIDISGWVLDTNGPENYVIPIGTILQPRQYAVFYGGQTGLTLGDDAGQVRLKDAQGRMIDRVQYDAVSPDGSYSRDEAGSWHADWPPSPGAPNGQPGNVIAQAKQPSLGTPEAALFSTLEKIITTIKEMIFGFFR